MVWRCGHCGKENLGDVLYCGGSRCGIKHGTASQTGPPGSKGIDRKAKNKATKPKPTTDAAVTAGEKRKRPQRATTKKGEEKKKKTDDDDDEEEDDDKSDADENDDEAEGKSEAKTRKK